MNGKKIYLLRLILLFSDFIILNVSYCGAYLLFTAFTDHHIALINLLLVALFNASWMGFAAITKLYAFKTMSNIETIYRGTWRTLAAQALVFVSIYYFLQHTGFNYSFILLCYGIMSIMLVLNRLLLTYITEFIFKKVVVKRKVLIVGDNTPGRQLANYFEKNKSFYSLTGIFDNKTGTDNNGLYKGKLESCIDFAAKNQVNYIYSTIFPDEDEHILELKNVAENNCIHMLFVGKNKPPVDNRYYRIHFIEAMPVMSLRAEPLLRQRNILRKRVFDIVFSAIVILLLMSWLTPLIAILIKLSSKGPIFFVQQRSGKDNKPFWCYKFRSMRVNDNSDTHQATRGDSRITRIGAFMRKTSIDELPQFFNVLIGNMSIVGPRPHMLKHTEEYSAIIDKYLVRHYLKPGITGWAQVNGYRGETINVALMEKRVEYDIAYMENWSLMQDVKIVFMTIINVLKGEENAR